MGATGLHVALYADQLGAAPALLGSACLEVDRRIGWVRRAGRRGHIVLSPPAGTALSQALAAAVGRPRS